MDKEKNTVILARVSSKSQEDEGYSLDSQEKLLNGYCESRDLNVVRIFKIAETASKEQSRKTFQEMMAYISNGNIYHLVIEKTDRFTRNFHDAVAIDDWLNAEEKRRLHAVKENLLLHKEAKSDVKFMWNIHVSVAKKYADNLREEAMKGWAEKLAQGWLPAVPPPGYITVPLNGKKIHIPDPNTKTLIQRAFALYLEPQHTVASVTEEMRLMGLRTRKGRPYVQSQVQRSILTNPFYIGINRFDGKEHPGAQEPIISKSIFESVQRKMHRGRPTRYRRHNPIFKNIITCGNCGDMVTWQLQKGRFYGTCQRKSETCKGRKLLREDVIEAQIVDMLRTLVCPSQEIISWVANMMREKHKERIEGTEKLVASIQTQITRINRMCDTLYDDKLAGDISADKYKEKLTELTSQRAALEAQLDKHDTTAGLRLEQRLVLLELSQKAAEIYPNKTPEQKRLIITKLFTELTFTDDSLSVTFTNFTRVIAQKVQKTHKLIGGAK